MSNPYNLEVSSKMLQGTLLGREVYLRVLGGSMKKLVALHKDELEKYTKLDVPVLSPRIQCGIPVRSKRFLSTGRGISVVYEQF